MTISVQNKQYLNFINGKGVPSSSQEMMESLNPANKKEAVGYVQKSTLEDLNIAVKAAKQAKKNGSDCQAQLADSTFTKLRILWKID